jgi:multiple sugar transport system substrate-binding protein
MSESVNPLHRPLSRRQALQVMGGLAGMSVLAACAAPVAAPSGGAASSTAGESAAPAATGGSMVVAHRKEYFEEMETLFADAVKEWGAANNYEIETTTVAAEAFEDFVAKLVAQVQAGEPPDLVYHVRLVQQLYSFGALEVVSDVVAQAEELYGEAPYGQRNANLIDGEWYGIPYIMSGGGAYARRSWFEEGGFDPLALETFEQRREAALAVSDPSAERYGWGVTIAKSGDGRGFIESVIQNWGGHYTDENMTQITFNSPETIAAVEWLAETYTSETYAPMLPPGILSWTDSSNNEAFLAGNIGYTHNAASIYAKAKADGNPIFEDTVHLPTAIGPLGQKLEAGGGGQFNIPKGAAQIEGAKALALHMLTPEIFLPISLISAGLFLPAYAGVDALPEVQAAYEADPNLASMSAATKGSHPGSSWPAQPSPFFDAIQAQAIIEEMMAQVVNNGVPVEEAVAQAADRMQQIADEMGALG